MDDVRKAAVASKEASYRLQSIPGNIRNKALEAIADMLSLRRRIIVSANEKDLAEANMSGLSQVLLKRLKYDDAKIDESLDSIWSLVKQEDVVGKVISRTELDAGLVLEKVTCPIGVIGVVFESRPEALVQISSLCIKSGNAVLLKGGSEAKNTNEALAAAINDAIVRIDERFTNAVQLLSTREEFQRLLQQDDKVDLIIPRGSNQLVRSIQNSTRIPVLGHAAGVCHTYVDNDADMDMAVRVCYDAKVQYPAVCNAMETLLVHEGIAGDILPKMAEAFSKAKVVLRGDAAVRRVIKADAVVDDDWSTEYNDLILSIKVVESIEEAIEHINTYGSHHTDAIITSDPSKAKLFQDQVDSASVMWNCSTRFADGYRYGLGAEVGISTNKTHARGPVGLEGLAIYKYRLNGSGHIVADYVGPNAKKYTHRKLR
ncbi:MAG: glutamate-5-semialdehyde dehydrogenase [Euryarchaeota archaeon]|nr:glutamate-5-semialdehyde dehydrogenase [Euryarchaeota archaeon]